MSVKHTPDYIERAYHHVNKNKLVTMTGLPPGIVATLSTQDAEMLCVFSETLSDLSSWVLADLLLWAEERVAADLGTGRGVEFYTQRDKAWTQLLRLTKRDYTQATLRNMRAVARAFPYARRRISNILSFKHHRLLVSLTESEQDYYLDLCEDMGWNSAQLERHLYERRNAFDPEIDQGSADGLNIAATVLQRKGIHLERLDKDIAIFVDDSHQIEVRAALREGTPHLEFFTTYRPGGPYE